MKLRAEKPPEAIARLLARRDWLDKHLLSSFVRAVEARREYRAIARGLARLRKTTKDSEATSA